MNLSILKKIFNGLFNTRAAGVYILLFAFFIGLATFVENDFGTASAQKVIFKSWWFELLLLLFAVCLIVNILKYRMIQNRRWALFTFHASMIIILLGSAVTRYFGFEGMMHIREGDTSNSFLSAENYLKFEVQQGSETYSFMEPVLFSSLGSNTFSESYLLGNDIIDVHLRSYVPNPVEEIVESEDGYPILKVVFGSAQGRQEYFLEQGTVQPFNGVLFNFSDETIPSAVHVRFEDNRLEVSVPKPMNITVMATQQRDTIMPSDGFELLRLRALYTDGVNSFVFGDFNASGKRIISSESNKIKSESLEAIQLDIKVNDVLKSATLYGRKGMAGRPRVLNFQNLNLAVSYGARERHLPFGFKLYDFIMER